jgi:hypothetical protein
MTFRQGIDSATDTKAVNITNGYNIILDHTSIAWSRYDNFGITSNSHDITLQDSMSYEGINNQRSGGFVDSSRRITLARNLFANTQTRNPKGKGDNTARAKYAIDGQAETVWRTEKYKQQLPAVKPGIGLIVVFQDPINLSQVKITGTAGTKVEIRSATAKNPDLADTKVIGNGDLKDGETTIPLAQPTQGEYFIVWITQLGDADGQFMTEIGDLAFLPAG